MANVYTNKTIRIDTTMTESYQAARGRANDSIQPVRVSGAKLLGGTATSSASITDPVSGDVLATLQCATGETDSLILTSLAHWRDFEVTLTGAGAVLEIYQG